MCVILILYFFFRKSDSSTNQLTVKVQRGNFTALVFSSGQLESEKSEMINIPEKLKDRNLRIWELAITDMIEEGTVVDVVINRVQPIDWNRRTVLKHRSFNIVGVVPSLFMITYFTIEL